MSHFKVLRKELETYLDKQAAAIFIAPILLAAQLHSSQKRVSGEPYIAHSCRGRAIWRPCV